MAVAEPCRARPVGNRDGVKAVHPVPPPAVTVVPTDDDRRGLVGDLTRRGLTRTEIADALSIDEAMVADHLG